MVPDFTTLHKACRRLLKLPACNRLLDETVRWRAQDAAAQLARRTGGD